MPSLADFIKNPMPSGIAGNSILKNDLLEIFPDGKFYTAQNTDYAASPNAGTTLLAKTVFPNSALTLSPSSINGAPACTDTNGNIYILTSYGGTTLGSSAGLVVQKYSNTGQWLSNVAIETTGNYNAGAIAQLTNGNLAVAYVGGISSAGHAKYAVIATNLVIVKSAVDLTGLACSGLPSIAVLSNGFAVVYGSYAVVSTFDNSGNAAHTAAVTLSGSVAITCATLSNGNLLVCTENGSVYFTIYDTSLNIVVAATNTTLPPGGNVSVPGQNPNIAILPGFFAVSSFNNSSTLSTKVYSNAGALIGTYTSASQTTPTANLGPAKYLLADKLNNQFVCVTETASNSFAISTINTAAGGTTIAIGGIIGVTSYANFACDIDGAANVVIDAQCYQSGSSQPYLYAYNLTLSQPLFTTTHSTNGGQNSYVDWYTPLCLNDGVALLLNNRTGDVGDLQITKYTNTALLGPAMSAASTGTSVSADSTAGVKTINPLKGTPSKAFTHKTTANIYGNSGGIAGNVVSQQGI